MTPCSAAAGRLEQVWSCLQHVLSSSWIWLAKISTFPFTVLWRVTTWSAENSEMTAEIITDQPQIANAKQFAEYYPDHILVAVFRRHTHAQFTGTTWMRIRLTISLCATIYAHSTTIYDHGTTETDILHFSKRTTILEWLLCHRFGFYSVPN